MKILKFFLLIFTVSFFVNDANAQVTDPTQPTCESFGFSMQITPIDGSPMCYEVTVSNGFPENLFIHASRNCHIESVTKTTSLTAVICFGSDACQVGNFFDPILVECGLKDDDGNELCRDGCIISVVP